MTNEKFKQEIDTLNSFFSKYCEDKHQNQKKTAYEVEYKNIKYEFELFLCEECNTLILYSFDRLKYCPHEIKPRCRKCPNPCYEKKQWKDLAKVMRYSAISLGLSKLKRFFIAKKRDEE